MANKTLTSLAIPANHLDPLQGARGIQPRCSELSHIRYRFAVIAKSYVIRNSAGQLLPPQQVANYMRVLLHRLGQLAPRFGTVTLPEKGYQSLGEELGR